MTENFCPALNQIAFSVIDLRRTEAWFREGLGFLPAGGNRFMMSIPLAGWVQGIPKAASTCWWMVGRNPWFQIEMFQFRRPMAKLLPSDFRPCDVGYTRIGVHVSDFDATLASLARLGSEPLSPPLGDARHRRACVRNPDGVFVEIFEDDPLPHVQGERDCPAAIRSVTLSTPDFDTSVAYIAAIAGHGPDDIALHGDEHETLWGLAGARAKRAVFRCGDILVEVVQYLEPVGRPWPGGYRICDQGILNIAFGARNKRDHMQVYHRATAFGAKPNRAPVHIPGSGVVYVNDHLGFSVEILWTAAGPADRNWGFEPLPLDKRPQADNRRIMGRVMIAAPVDRVWNILNDHDGMGGWIGFSKVRRVHDGSPDPNGYGAERAMQGLPGKIVEQVTGTVPNQEVRYRVIKGSPFVDHNGEIVLRPSDGNTEVTWTIRFRSRNPLLGPLLARSLTWLLTNMLNRGLKSVAEEPLVR